jgi:hypothetical protein
MNRVRRRWLVGLEPPAMVRAVQQQHVAAGGPRAPAGGSGAGRGGIKCEDGGRKDGGESYITFNADLENILAGEGSDAGGRDHLWFGAQHERVGGYGKRNHAKYTHTMAVP